MNKNIVIALVVLLIILAGGFAFLTFRNGESGKLNTRISNTQNNTSKKDYTFAEVASHNSESDCWTVIDNKVYDLTSFIPTHEGGNVITESCGIDSTTLFNERPNTENSPHPEEAQVTLENLFIGNLKTN